MSGFVDGVFVSEEEPHDVCELCGNLDDLRPYGPGGKRICCPCGELDIEATYRAFKEFFNAGEAHGVIDA